jgi:hypothetical protein
VTRQSRRWFRIVVYFVPVSIRQRPGFRQLREPILARALSGAGIISPINNTFGSVPVSRLPNVHITSIPDLPRDTSLTVISNTDRADRLTPPGCRTG